MSDQIIRNEYGDMALMSHLINFTLRRRLMLPLHHSLMVFGVLVGIALPLQPAAAQGGGETLVTDPNVLESMGFDRNSENVYMDKTASLMAAPDADAVAAETTPVTGTDHSAISAKDFIGRIDTTGTQWRYTCGPTSCTELSRFSTGTELFADAQFDVPTGATLTFFRFWAFDASASNLAFFVFEVCQPGFASGPPILTTIVSTTTNGTPGNTTGLVSLGSRPVNNQDCTYVARVRFDAATTNLALQKVRLQFQR